VGVRPEKITIRPDGGVPADPEWNSVTGLLRMSTYIGVSHQYKVEGPGGHELTVWVQNLGAEPAPVPGERVRLSWRWEHTFAVLPQEGISMEEEEE
jgi:spermidine/putrescine transport system ATP-binding protein